MEGEAWVTLLNRTLNEQVDRERKEEREEEETIDYKVEKKRFYLILLDFVLRPN